MHARRFIGADVGSRPGVDLQDFCRRVKANPGPILAMRQFAPAPVPTRPARHRGQDANAVAIRFCRAGRPPRAAVADVKHRSRPRKFPPPVSGPQADSRSGPWANPQASDFSSIFVDGRDWEMTPGGHRVGIGARVGCGPPPGGRGGPAPPLQPRQAGGRCTLNRSAQCRRYEVPAPPAANSIRNFKSKSGTGIVDLLVPFAFRNSF